jgi:hypothetical protein
MIGDSISKITDFYMSSSNAISAKLTVAVCVIITLITIDIIFDISYNWSVNTSLEQLDKISKLRNEYEKQGISQYPLNRFASEINDEVHYSKNLKSWYIAKKKDGKERYSYWGMFFSINWWMIIFLCVVVATMFSDTFIKEVLPSKNEAKHVVTMFFLWIVGLCVLTEITYLIPTFKEDSNVLNYMMNVFISIILLTIWAFILNSDEPKPVGDSSQTSQT